MLPQFLAALYVERKKICAVIHQIESIPVDDWRRVTTANAVNSPLNVRFSKSSFSSSVNRDEQSHLIGVEILFAVSSKNSVAAYHRAVVNTAFGDCIGPHRFAGVSFYCAQLTT